MSLSVTRALSNVCVYFKAYMYLFLQSSFSELSSNFDITWTVHRDIFA